MSLAVAARPAGAAHHPHRRGPDLRPAHRPEHPGRRRPDVYQHDEEGLQSSRSTRTSTPNNWVYIYYSPPLNTPVDDPATPDVNEGDAPATGTPADFAPFKGVDPAVALQAGPATSSTWPPSSRSSTCRSTAASAATSAATSTSTARATCTCPPATTRTRSPPTATAPIDDRPGPQPGVRRAAQRRQHQRPARQAAADQGRRPAAATRSRRATCSRRARRRPGPRSTRWACATRSASRSTGRNDDVYLGDYSPDAASAEPGPRARRARPVDARSRKPAQLRLAVLRDADIAVRRLRLRDRRRRASTFNCKRAGQRLAAQHRPARRCRRSTQPDVWYSYGAVGASSRSWAPAASARWAARRTTTTRTSTSRTPLAGRTTTACRCSTSGRATTSRSSASTADGSRLTRSAPVRRRWWSTTRWTWSSARTARSTCSSTATATSPRTRTRSSSRIDFVRGNRTPIAEGQRRRRPSGRPR